MCCCQCKPKTGHILERIAKRRASWVNDDIDRLRRYAEEARNNANPNWQNRNSVNPVPMQSWFGI